MHAPIGMLLIMSSGWCVRLGSFNISEKKLGRERGLEEPLTVLCFRVCPDAMNAVKHFGSM